MIELELTAEHKKMAIASIKVVGIGGAGGNTVNSIIENGCTDIETIVANTDLQALELSTAAVKVQIGIKSTKGLGTGADPLVGKRAAEEDIDKVMEAIGQADIVFLAAGMGGGTGSGALPVIAKALKDRGILSIVIVTKPFEFEGKRRARVAEEVIAQLRLLVDTLIVIPNQKLLQVADQHLSMIAAFGMINNILSQSVRSISDIITRPGHINVDYADVRAIMKDRGLAVMGTGKASGPDRAYAAALQAISSPLLENMNIEGAHGVLLNITGGKNLSLHELSQAASVVYQAAHEDANIILGSVIDENLGDEVHVTIIATGFDQPNKEIVQSKELMDKEDINKSLIYDQHDKKELHLQAAQKVEQVPVIVKAEQEKQDSYKEIAEQSLFQAHDTLHNNDELDLNDLDIPTFLREKQEKEQQF